MDSFLFVGLIINFGLSFIVASIAERKGRSFGGFWWLSFLLSFLIGILVVIAIPDESKQTLLKTEDKNEIRVKCTHCAEEILAEASVCKHCGRDVKPRKDLLVAAEEQKQNAAIAEEAMKVDSQLRSERNDRLSLVFSFYFISALFLFLCLALVSANQFGSILVGSISALCAVIASVLIYKLPPKPEQKEPLGI